MSYRLPSADGYIFDFNGTLFWDSEENREAWSAIFRKYRGQGLSDEEFALLNGRTDDETVLYLSPEMGRDERTMIALEKEALYKEICLSHDLSLSPGAEELLEYLSRMGKKMAIASSAPAINREWYIPEFRLERFFRKELIIAGRTDIPAKPDPAIFIEAMKALGCRSEDTVIFEDSDSGIRAALATGAKLVVRICEKGPMDTSDPRILPIRSFLEIIREER